MNVLTMNRFELILLVTIPFLSSKTYFLIFVLDKTEDRLEGKVKAKKFQILF